ncbi:MAG TPA: 5'-3' exonuclease H3TH domain-containing protein [Candidatus Kryptonia bacterium]|nr:5'-3' exonuclease H3TH domain-containing protein [Candidatus Kryptonia bacterium]
MILHLLDATFELFRAYFAMPSETAPDGCEVGAVRGLIGSTLALLRQPEVTHIAAATDHVIESFRNHLFAGYKTGEGIAPDLWTQFPLAEKALRGLGVVVWPMVEFEADDALATAARRFADQVDQVVILSPDKDLTQCVVANRVVTHDRIRRKTYDDAGVREKFGVAPASIPDLLALVGDSADGIPGIRGWGMKSAAAVLSVYHSIESIPADARNWTIKLRQAPNLAASLTAQRDDALLFKTLATLRTDVPLRETLDDLEWHGVDRGAYVALCQRFGFRDLVDRPARWRSRSV